MRKRREQRHCPDCGVEIGEVHLDGCDVERCLRCGGQKLSCGCKKRELTSTPRQVWSGEWPGLKECRELNLWCKSNPNGVGWVKCDRNDPEATEDLNALSVECFWDRKTMSWQLKGVVSKLKGERNA